MQIYRLISPVWISKNMVRFFFLRGSSRNLNLLIPERRLPFRDFLFLSGVWGMIPVAVVGLWFVYRGRGRLFISQCRFYEGAVFALSVGLSDALSCLVSVWPDILIAGCRVWLCFFCSIIGQNRNS